MGELVYLEEYKEKLLIEEVQELKQRLEKIIQENDLYVENSAYYNYNDNDIGLNDCFVFPVSFQAFDFYY